MKKSYIRPGICIPGRLSIRILMLDTVGPGSIVGVGISLIFISALGSFINHVVKFLGIFTPAPLCNKMVIWLTPSIVHVVYV